MLATELLSEWPTERWVNRRLLLGVSGGADSVALLFALHELAGRDQLTVAHLNHGWRDKESDEDAAFVVKLCDKLDRPCITRKLQYRDTDSPSQNDDTTSRNAAMLANNTSLDSLVFCNETSAGECNEVFADGLLQKSVKTEENARRARYEFFKQSAYEAGASYVLTAHTADDRVETLLHNLLRGSGPAGAASLVMFRTLDEDLVLVRPLLRKRRHEIETFLKVRAQETRHDSTNDSSHYKRNFLRREILPVLAQQFPGATENLLRYSELTEELLADWDKMAQTWLAQVEQELSSKNTSVRQAIQRWPEISFYLIPQSMVAATPWSVVQAALRQVWLKRGWPLADMSRTHWRALHDLAGQLAGVENLPAGLRAEIKDGFLAIGRHRRGKV